MNLKRKAELGITKHGLKVLVPEGTNKEVADGIMALIRNSNVEEEILKRMRQYEKVPAKDSLPDWRKAGIMIKAKVNFTYECPGDNRKEVEKAFKKHLKRLLPDDEEDDRFICEYKIKKIKGLR